MLPFDSPSELVDRALAREPAGEDRGEGDDLAEVLAAPPAGAASGMGGAAGLGAAEKHVR